MIVLITDNLNTHTPACLYETFAPEEARRIASKLEWHDTPEHASWLDVAECELSVLARQCLARRSAMKEALMAEVTPWEQKRNAAQVTIHWNSPPRMHSSSLDVSILLLKCKFQVN